jgi:hypothetical protein
MKWITRERPKIDRIACPWLIARFIDKEPEFLYVPASQVMAVAASTGAIPYDVPGVEFTHVGEDCSFDTFIKKHSLTTRNGQFDNGLQDLAVIVRGADTDRLDLAPQAAGLLACWRFHWVCRTISRTTFKCWPTAWCCMTRCIPGVATPRVKNTAGLTHPCPNRCQLG